MFKTVLTAATTAASPMRGLDAAVLWHRLEAAVAARKLAFCAEILIRHLNSADTVIGTLPGGVDPADAAEAELAAALGTTCRTAGRWMWLGHALSTRLPNLAAMFADGEVTQHQVTVIIDGTANVDPEFIKLVESAILTQLTPHIVGKKLRALVDSVIARIDLDGLRARRDAAVQGRHVHVHTAADGMVDVAGSLTAEDGKWLDHRLDEMAKRVCSNDPRSFAARRADALIALGHGDSELACLCGGHDCPFSAGVAGTPRRALVHVVATAATLNGTSDAPAWIDGYGIISADHARRLATDADLRALKTPSTEDRYRPSRDLADWVKAVHGWCAFPGCGQPAWGSDLDHRTPHGERGGETSESNLGPFCRKHHNLHTHGGWHTEQLDDGTLLLTDPEDRTYRIPPLGPIPLITKQPRTKQRANRIRCERNQQHQQNSISPGF